MTAIGHDARTTAIVEQIRRRNARDTHEVVRVEEKLPEGYNERLDLVEAKLEAFANLGKAFDDLDNRVTVIEDRPPVVAPANDAVAVPAAFGKLVDDLDAVKAQVADLTDGFVKLVERPEPASDAEMAERMVEVEQAIAEAATFLKYINMLQNEQEAQRRRINVMNDQIVDITEGLAMTSRAFKESA